MSTAAPANCDHENRGAAFSRVGAGVALTLAMIAGTAWFAAVAGAGVTNFSLSPTSGPAGTVVSVNGSGCSPGLVLSSALDYVHVAIGTAPPTSAQLAVAANGAWNGTFTIPSNAAAAPAAVTAICVSDGLQSQLTIYLPKTFTVTSATPTSPPTTAPSTTAPSTTAPSTTGPSTTGPSTTVPGATPTTRAGGTPTTHGASTTIGHDPGTSPGDPTTSTTGSSAGANPKGPTLGGNDPNGPTLGDDPGTPAKTKDAATQSRRADLSAPDLTLPDSHSSRAGVQWLLWLFLVAALVTAAVGAWWYRTRPHPGVDAVGGQ